MHSNETGIGDDDQEQSPREDNRKDFMHVQAELTHALDVRQVLSVMLYAWGLNVSFHDNVLPDCWLAKSWHNLLDTSHQGGTTATVARCPEVSEHV